jgi:hypothetical protein
MWRENTERKWGYMWMIEYILNKRARETYRYTVEERKYNPKLYWKTKKCYLLIDNRKVYSSKLLYASDYKRLLCIMRDIWRYKKFYRYPYTQEKSASTSLYRFTIQRDPVVNQAFETYMKDTLREYYEGDYNFFVKKLPGREIYQFYMKGYDHYTSTHIVYSDHLSFLCGSRGKNNYPILRKYLFAKQKEGSTLILGSDINTYEEFPSIESLFFYRIEDLTAQSPYEDVNEDALFTLLDVLHEPERYRQNLEDTHTVLIDRRWESVNTFLLETIEQAINQYKKLHVICLFNEIPEFIAKKQKGG